MRANPQHGEAVLDIGGAESNNFTSLGVLNGPHANRRSNSNGRVWRFFSRVRNTLRPSLAGPSHTAVMGSGAANDGVFANLAVKPEVEAEVPEDLPPV